MTDRPDQDPVSLDELARAFAQVMGDAAATAALRTSRNRRWPKPLRGPTSCGRQPPHEAAVAVDEAPGDGGAR